MIKEKRLLIRTKCSLQTSARSLVKITDRSEQHFTTTQPDADNIQLSRLAILPKTIASDKIGLGFINDVHVVKKASGETVVAGDKVGTKKDDWFAKEFCRGMLFTLDVKNSDDLIVRPTVRDIITPDIYAVGEHVYDATRIRLWAFNYDFNLIPNQSVGIADADGWVTVKVDDLGNVYAGSKSAWDLGYNRGTRCVWKYDRYGNLLKAYSPESPATIVTIHKLVVNSDYSIVIAYVKGEPPNRYGKVKKVNSNWEYMWHWDVPNEGGVRWVRSITTDANGDVYVTGECRSSTQSIANVWKLNGSTGGLIWSYRLGDADNYTDGKDIKVKGRTVWVVGKEEDEWDNLIKTIWKLTQSESGNSVESLDWSYLTSYAANAVLNDDDSNIFVAYADRNPFGGGIVNHSVCKLDSGGNLDTSWATGGRFETGHSAYGLAFDNDGNLHIVGAVGSGTGNPLALWKLSPNGVFLNGYNTEVRLNSVTVKPFS